jgi:predicted RNase H-like nuclease
MSILGIDSAWTLKNPSGVALLNKGGSFIAAAPSYTAFINHAAGESIDWSRPAKAGGSVAEVLEVCSHYLPNDPVSFIAVDMPVSTVPITQRRECDNIVSRKFGANRAGTHSPTEERPGKVSSDFSKAMDDAGFKLAAHQAAPTPTQYIEVYPHTALLRLTGDKYRLEYKEGKRSKYWPDASIPERKTNLLRVWERIVGAIEEQVGEVGIPIIGPISLKPVEDAIDAVICAWVGHQFQIGRAESLGDQTSAIWTPFSSGDRESKEPELDLPVGSTREKQLPLAKNTNRAVRKAVAGNDSLHSNSDYMGSVVQKLFKRNQNATGDGCVGAAKADEYGFIRVARQRVGQTYRSIG